MALYSDQDSGVATIQLHIGYFICSDQHTVAIVHTHVMYQNTKELEKFMLTISKVIVIY